MIVRHANERLYVGPNTTEIILSLGRVHQTTMATQGVDVSLRLNKRTIKPKHRRKLNQKMVVHGGHSKHRHVRGHTDFELIAYIVDENGNAHFELSDEFLIDAEKGFYDAQLYMSDCEVCELEIVKAPSIHVQSSRTIDNTCSSTQWVEPGCDKKHHKKSKPCKKCGTEYSCKNKEGGTCYVCLNENVVTTADLNPDYINLGLIL